MVTLTPGDGTASPGTRVWARTQEFVDSVRSFTAFQKRSPPLVSANDRNVQSASLDRVGFSEGDHLLQALNGFVLVVTTDGTVFYASPTIQDFLGFHQSDVLHQSVFDLVHVDDREMFRCQLHFALNPNDTDSHVRAEDGQQSGSKCPSRSVSSLPQYVPPENSSFLERSFCCRLRCLLDNTSGFLALNFTGHLKYLHLQGNTGADGSTAPPSHLALFAIATPVQPPSVMEIRTKTLIFQTKHSMDFAPVGIDTRGKLVLGYSEIELVSTGSGYQFIHAADMMYCADNHLKMMKTGDSGFTFFRLLTKTKHWLWVQANARIVFKDGRPDFIIARQKALTNEEGEEHLHQRRRQLPFNLATGEGVLYDTWMDSFSIPGPPGSGAPTDTAEPSTVKPLDPASLLGSLHRQDHSVYTEPQTPSPLLPIFSQIDDLDLEQSPMEQAFLDSHALLSVPGQTVQASQKRSVTGDLTSEAMIDSLEQILADIGDGGFEDLQVEETELRDWENTVVRMNNEREDAARDLNHILANDVFSYVEEALRRETMQGSGQITDTEFAEGDVLGGVGTSALWPPNSSSHHQMIPAHPLPDATQPPWFTGTMEQSLNHAGPQRTHIEPSVWQQQQQLPQSFHHHTLTHSSHTPGGVNSAAPSFQLPQAQRLSGSCMYEKREAHIPNAATGPLLGGPTHVTAGTSANAAFAVGVINQGATQPSGPCGDVGNISLVHLSGDGAGVGTARSENSSFFCWNGDTQIPRVPLNGVADPFPFPTLRYEHECDGSS
ncbi:Aryl hydrocarbon receptor [Collichthys lucidus]|uniref:Aryl hydrocarbon receptor n=1 Tax=Collichthys lucidus TaxID=240159 RepID=A0A4U5VBT9_COLLU|nr:Aryl hydrocarbon receptor [Collichthys lucidus]